MSVCEWVGLGLCDEFRSDIVRPSQVLVLSVDCRSDIVQVMQQKICLQWDDSVPSMQICVMLMHRCREFLANAQM